MNRKKIASLVLSAAILIGAAGFGAYSWFKSTATLDPNLIIQTGTLAITPQGESDWEVQSVTNNNEDLKTEVTDVNVSNNFENVRPGDSFTKIVTFKNTGTLKERVKFEINKEIINDKYKGLFDVKVTNTGDGEIPKEVVLKKNGIQKVKIVVTLSGERTMGEDKQPMQKSEIKLSEFFNDPLVIAKGEQVNENPQK